MRKKIALSVLLFLLGFSSSYGQESSSLEGVWKIVYQKMENPETTVELTEFEFPSYKIYTEKFFSLSRQNKNDQFAGHFGKYSYDGESYTEHIKFSSYEAVSGQSVKFKSKMKGDKWTIKGTFEIEGGEMKMTETWQRVE